MSYQSKYFNIDTYYANWAKDQGWVLEDFAGFLEKVEALPREKLIDLCRMPDVRVSFTESDWEKIMPEFEILSALLMNHGPAALMPALNAIDGTHQD